MKKTITRNNPRKINPNPFQQKPVHSQSPNHKKLLKKIELTQRDNPQYQYEMSLQDNMVFQKPQEEVVDFRVEIERRYQKSFANHTFIFPKKKPNNEDILEDSGSSNNSSFESLRHVTVYELASQNNKKRQKPSKPIYRTHDDLNARDSRNGFSKDRMLTEPDRGMDSDDSNQGGLPIEIRIQDKSSNTYKNLIGMLEKQLNKNSNAIITESKPLYTQKNEDSQRHEEKVNNYVSQHVQPKEVKKDSKDINKRPSTNPQLRKTMLMKDESQRSIGLNASKARLREGDSRITDKSDTGISFQEGVEKLRKSTKGLEVSQRLKKTNSKEKVGSLLDASSGNGESLVSLDSRLSPNTKKVMAEMSRFSQENKKKIINSSSSNSLLRALTPKSIVAKSITNLKDKNIKIEKQPQSNQAEISLSSQTPSSTLYQKAQDDVINGKMRLTTQKSQKSGLKSTTDTSKANTEEMFKGLDIKGANFIDFYGSPKIQQQRTPQAANHTVYSGFAKMRSTKRLDGRAGEKSSERQTLYSSYELTSSKSKPTFKLDLSTKMTTTKQSRDMLSSTRMRDNMSKDKSSEKLHVDSILKASYDMQNHSLIRNAANAAKQSEITKKKLGTTPKGNYVKKF